MGSGPAGWQRPAAACGIFPMRNFSWQFPGDEILVLSRPTKGRAANGPPFCRSEEGSLS